MDIMDDASRQTATAWQFVRQHLGRIVVGVILVGIVYGAIAVVLPYQREKRMARKVETLGGKVEWDYYGSNFVPLQVRDKFPFFHRIQSVELRDQSVAPDDALLELASLSKLKSLMLVKSNCQVEPQS